MVSEDAGLFLTELSGNPVIVFLIESSVFPLPCLGGGGAIQLGCM